MNGLGCPCVGGQAFAPFSGPGRFTIPRVKAIEHSMESLIINYIALKLRGGYARAIFQKPTDLRDYAYEHSKIMALKGDVFFDNWPASCAGNLGGACGWDFYRANRKYYIQEVHSLDFTDTGYPLQDKTGGNGYCVDKVEEFYGRSTIPSAAVLMKEVVDNIATTVDDLFPNDGVVSSAGPHLYGVGVFTDSTSGATTFWLTIIRVTLITSAPCECAIAPCAAA